MRSRASPAPPHVRVQMSFWPLPMNQKMSSCPILVRHQGHHQGHHQWDLWHHGHYLWGLGNDYRRQLWDLGNHSGQQKWEVTDRWTSYYTLNLYQSYLLGLVTVLQSCDCKAGTITSNSQYHPPQSFKPTSSSCYGDFFSLTLKLLIRERS